MSKKSHTPGPIPPANRPHTGTAFRPEDADSPQPTADQPEAGFQEEDPNRRLGDYTATAEHARQQPGPLNDGGRRHGEDAQ